MLIESNCRKRKCKHYVGVKNNGDEMTERVSCKAFPNKIPFIIAYGDNKHLKPFRGDNGIQFEKE